MAEPEVLPQPAEFFRMSYCSYCIHERKAHTDDGPCERCKTEGNGFWPECPRFTASPGRRRRGACPIHWLIC